MSLTPFHSRSLPLALGLAAFAFPAAAETVRVATFNTGLSARGPGLMLAEIAAGKSPRAEVAARMIAVIDPDILVLQDIDYDAGLAGIGAFADKVAEAGAEYPHRFTLRPNTGMSTGLDMNGDGRTGGPRDAQGYGRFAGAAGMAILSRHPIDRDGVIDLSPMLWRDLPGAIPLRTEAGFFPSPEAHEVQRLSTTAHWIVPVEIGGTILALMTWHATPPVFDGPEDMNGRRNHDEAALWSRLLDGALDVPAPAPPFVILGDANLDIADGDGRPEALAALIADPRVRDPQPLSEGGRLAANPGHGGDPATDTARYDDPPGNLRVDYLLPSADIAVEASDVFWPAAGSPAADALSPPEDWPRHGLVWADLALGREAH